MSKLTKEQLQGMSDFELNKALAVLLGFKLSNWLNNNYGHYEVEGTSLLAQVKNYCNTPNDIMPLAFEHLVNIQWFMDSKEVRAYTHSGKSVTVGYQHTYRQKAALRAHVCCLILVLQEGK